jgi:hypothetical protein
METFAGCLILATSDIRRHKTINKVMHTELAIKHGLTHSTLPYYKKIQMTCMIIYINVYMYNCEDYNDTYYDHCCFCCGGG